MPTLSLFPSESRSGTFPRDGRIHAFPKPDLHKEFLNGLHWMLQGHRHTAWKPASQWRRGPVYVTDALGPQKSFVIEMRARREAAGLSRYKLAERLGCPQWLGKVENFEKPPSEGPTDDLDTFFATGGTFRRLWEQMVEARRLGLIPSGFRPLAEAERESVQILALRMGNRLRPWCFRGGRALIRGVGVAVLSKSGSQGPRGTVGRRR